MNRSNLIHLICMTFAVVGLPLTADSQERMLVQPPVAEIEGIQLFLQLSDPIDADNPIVICDLLNTTNKPVPFALRGARNGYSLMPHLYDASGRELARTEEWTRLFDTGDSLRFRYGALRPGIVFGPIPIDLKLAYGENWSKGETLTIEWDSMPKEKKTGPHGGDFGVGHGVAGSIDISPLFKNRLRNEEPPEVNVSTPEQVNSVVLPVPPITAGAETKPTRPSPQPSQEPTFMPFRRQFVLTACFLLILVGLILWIRAKRRAT